MADVDALLGRFVDDWAAGRRPDVDAFLAGLDDPAERRDFARGVEAYLAAAPPPDYPDAVLDELLTLPAVQSAASAFGAGGPARALAEARAERGLSVRELAARVGEALGITGREDKLAFYLDGLEAGTIPPQPVRRRAWEGIAEALGVAAGRLAVPLPPPAAAGITLLRSHEPAADVAHAEVADLAEELLADASPGSWDEVDDLFRG